jgi:hypothetical protein
MDTGRYQHAFRQITGLARHSRVPRLTSHDAALRTGLVWARR